MRGFQVNRISYFETAIKMTFVNRVARSYWPDGLALLRLWVAVQITVFVPVDSSPYLALVVGAIFNLPDFCRSVVFDFELIDGSELGVLKAVDNDAEGVLSRTVLVNDQGVFYRGGGNSASR